jgi:Mg2+ and Co2+ transporter CorA
VNWKFGYAGAIAVTAISTGLTYWYFKRRGWLGK